MLRASVTCAPAYREARCATVLDRHLVAVVVRGVPVDERRDGQEGAGGERPHPGEVHESIRLTLVRRDPVCLSFRVVRDLVDVVPHGGHEPKLIARGGVEDERAEAAGPCLPVVDDLGHRRLEPEIAAVAADAAVVGEPFGVPSEIELVVRLAVAAGAHDQLRFIVAFEAGARHHVEDAVGAVAVLRVVAAPLHVQVIHVLRIELRSDIGGDVRVRHRNAVDEPAHLVAAAKVQLVVGHVRPRHERQNGFESIGPTGAWRELHVAPAHERRRRHRTGRRTLPRRRDRHALRQPCDLQWNMKDRTGARDDGDRQDRGLEAVEANRDGVVPGRHRGELELPLCAADDRFAPIGADRRERHAGAGNRPMLRVMDDAVDAGG